MFGLTAAATKALTTALSQALTPALSHGEREKAGVGTTPLRGKGGISGAMIQCGRWCEG